jgi:hypothetical protein
MSAASNSIWETPIGRWFSPPGGCSGSLIAGIWNVSALQRTKARSVASGAAFIVYGGMFSHVVIFWTDPSKPDAPEELIEAAEKYLVSIPGIVNFHVGKMVISHRDVVDQTYQVALNIQFQSKKAQDEYQVHPQHLEFVKQCKPLSAKLVIYDFE